MRSFTLVFFLVLSSLAYADQKPPKDHPLISPYKGSKILESTVSEYDAIQFPLEPAERAKGKTLSLEGKVSRISYQNPPERSTLEVFRNYQQALQRSGFTQTLYLTGSKQLYSGHALAGTLGLNVTSFCYDPSAEKTHYYIAKKNVGDAPAYVVVFVAPCKPDKTVLWVVEPKAMDSNQVEINSAALAESIERDGHVALYGILFDTNKAEIKPASVPMLKEVAKLLRTKPNLNLFVVGHTDQEGELNYNLDLSKKRAAAVTQWLATSEKIPASRLSAHGMGPLAPVATNRNEEGRAKNRRVELIERLR